MANQATTATAAAVAPEISHADRLQRLVERRAGLQAKHSASVDALREQMAVAEGVHDAMQQKLQADHEAAFEAAFTAFQQRAASALDVAVAEYLEKSDRKSGNAVAALVRTLNVDKLYSVGEPFTAELAHSFAASMVARVPEVAAKCGNVDFFQCGILGCGEASFAAVRCLLESDEPSLHADALSKLEIAVGHARQNNPVAQGAERWRLLRFGGSKKAIATQQAELGLVKGLRGLDVLRALDPRGGKPST